MIIGDLVNVLRAGNELKNAETWKKRQALTAAIFVLLTGLAGVAALLGYPLPFANSRESIQGVAELLGLVGFGLFQLWATFATTRRIGLPPRGVDTPAGTADGSGNGAVAGRPAVEGNDAGPVDPLPDMSRRG